MTKWHVIPILFFGITLISIPFVASYLNDWRGSTLEVSLIIFYCVTSLIALTKKEGWK